MSDMTNPHDRLIRETLQDKEDAISFFKNSLPEKVIELLDLNRLELTQSSFISENLKEEQTDLLFQIPLKSGKKANVYLLFEHKSYLDEAVFSQLLGYISAIYKSQFKTDKRYSVVIPFVFYHGERTWTLGNSFQDRFILSKNEEEVFKKYIPDFELELFDLSKVDLNRLESITLRVILGVVQKIWEGDASFLGYLGGVFELLTGLKNESKRVEIFQKLFLYIFNVRELKPTEITNLLSHSRYNREYEDLAMTTAEKLKKEGEIKGKIETARNMLLNGASLEFVLKVTGFTEQELKDHGVI
ncbi:Rpn family recombination-promoting nuclease/putative transposase (plasmid) [Leptospira interrogans serovar Canicola]|uniref:Rpn family recombination-promoting nuclease/putative transposase n=2 Tax=Leptospira interrogans TaxID=173 RepID=A0AAQ0B114_LEPIR|nr:Rpn family recombination-promoting nuclease/putative transposase [Leptospira interrogans]KAA1292629.1 transposase [Leptospira interrogans serovar Geyaweera]QOI45085.1 Rpn family recombination-promoting nuclease/putative transposase [Leptospira interrogans serovar Canicola]